MVASQAEPPTFATLNKAQCASLTTFRKNGAAVATPVWFAEHGGIIYIDSLAHTGKVKRIRHTARVTLAPCTFGGAITGPTMECRARIVSDPQEMKVAEAALAHKYFPIRWIYYSLSALWRAIRRKAEPLSVYIAVEPVSIA
ncbi:MAG TPA: PPOX class F420-dependent oxidoreductase [Ktedonobacteraceae bacterium]|jgi:PPOX class probable F420-dependent enzyme|nr:PPOX class F420-dependent oxidoreductase [Ktedonobacteraceae bacterium]